MQRKRLLLNAPRLSLAPFAARVEGHIGICSGMVIASSHSLAHTPTAPEGHRGKGEVRTI